MKRLIFASLIIVLILISLLIWFFWSDLETLRPNTRANFDAESFTFIYGETPFLIPDQHRVFVDASQPLLEAIRSRLITHLQDEQTFGGVEQQDTFSVILNQAQIIVILTDGRYIWTPVYSQANFVMKVGYSSNGDLKWISRSVVNMDDLTQSTVWIRGDIYLEDSTYGLMSRSTYLNYLGDEISLNLIETLTNLLQKATQE